MVPRQPVQVQCNLDSKSLTFETGHIAEQATAAILLRSGDNVLIATLVVGQEVENDSEPGDFQEYVPFMVEYREKHFAVGKFPGGFFKREGRPSTEEIVTSRLIDRPLRPLFPDGWQNDSQVIVSVLSSDGETMPDVLAVNAASACFAISDVPNRGPVACVRVGRLGGAFVVNPTRPQVEQSDMNLVVCSAPAGIIMVEFQGREIPEEEVLRAFEFARPHLEKLIEAQNELARKVGTVKSTSYNFFRIDPALVESMRQKYGAALKEALFLPKKADRYGKLAEIELQAVREACQEEGGQPKAGGPAAIDVLRAINRLKEEIVRREALDGRRGDGRGLKDIRPIWCTTGMLPRAHGSAMFTRGETQALGIVTLGSKEDEQKVDTIFQYYRRFMLHYNFPSFSTGEVKPIRSPGRREIGHGNLAERAIEPVLPGYESFPYTIRVVSEILSSNGSTSMASVCAGTLALMDAGVPLRAPVAGIAMGLIQEEGRYVVLSDILGSEDALGDMDFKVAGSRKGITALQLDLKTPGVDLNVLRTALEQAREGRLFILDRMLEVLPGPRPELSPHAPKVERVFIGVDKIGMVIGGGGRTVREIEEKTGCQVEFDDQTGHAIILSKDAANLGRARQWILQIAEGLKVGQIYRGRVSEIRDFGVFVEVFPTGLEGMVHISDLADGYVERVDDYLQVGMEVDVKVIEVREDTGKVKMSIKQALRELGKPPLQPLRPIVRSQERVGRFEERARGPVGERGPWRERGPRPPERRSWPPRGDRRY